jgi:hypothetical protein
MRLVSWTVDAGVDMSDSFESSNEKWIYSGPMDARVSSYVGNIQIVITNATQAWYALRPDKRLYFNKGLSVNDFWG